MSIINVIDNSSFLPAKLLVRCMVSFSIGFLLGSLWEKHLTMKIAKSVPLWQEISLERRVKTFMLQAKVRFSSPENFQFLIRHQPKQSTTMSVESKLLLFTDELFKVSAPHCILAIAVEEKLWLQH